MLNKQKLPDSAGGKDSQRKDPAGKTYGDQRKGNGIDPLSFDPVKRSPYWEDPPKVININAPKE